MRFIVVDAAFNGQGKTKLLPIARLGRRDALEGARRDVHARAEQDNGAADNLPQAAGIPPVTAVCGQSQNRRLES